MKSLRRTLPSLNALSAFNAAARHQSVTRAAQELALTESAVSRQIVALEKQLGIRLFSRVKKRMTLTQAGRVYGRQVAQTLERIERDALEIMAHEGAGAILELTALPTVASEWLIPRLGSFYARNPEVTINLSAHSRTFLFSESPFDGAIYFGKATWPGTQADYLFGERLLPVGKRELLGKAASLSVRQLSAHRLLHLVTRPDAWRDWFAAAGVVEVNPMKGARFELQSMLISAACAGQGVALLPHFLIAPQIKSGVLAVLSDLSVRSEGAYYFAYPLEKATLEPLNLFRSWLQAEAKAFQGDAVTNHQRR